MENKTLVQFDAQAAICRKVFELKLHDYGTSWHVLRLTSLADQIFIKAQRIRTIDSKKSARIAEGIEPEFIGIVNYAIIGLMSLTADRIDQWPKEKILQAYDDHMQRARTLMCDKNHDYGEAWRDMLLSSFTDLILMRVLRIRSLAAQESPSASSEGIDANLYDVINYAIFALILLSEQA